MLFTEKNKKFRSTYAKKITISYFPFKFEEIEQYHYLARVE